MEKAKKAAKAVKEVAEASEQAAYDYGVLETQTRLAEELAEVCKDFCKEVWVEALNRVGVPATSEWGFAENVFHPKDIREIPADLPSPSTLALPPSGQPFSAEASLLPPDALTRPDKASNQSQELKVAKGKEASQGGAQLKDKSKEATTLPKAEGKEAAHKVKGANSKAKDDPPFAKA